MSVAKFRGPAEYRGLELGRNAAVADIGIHDPDCVTIPGGRAFEKIAAQLREQGVAYTLHEHIEVGTIEQALQSVPELTVNLLKTVAFEVARTDRIIFVAVACTAKVDYKRVSAALGCSRRALRLLDNQRLEHELGFAVGGVGPFRVEPAIEVILDEGFAEDDLVKVGGGTRQHTFELGFGALAAISDAHIARVSRISPA
jgi:prolyl-tRNA editing enzyme YbaK/EbsC (Cys-tRNA(Pro) deacylase)